MGGDLTAVAVAGPIAGVGLIPGWRIPDGSPIPARGEPAVIGGGGGGPMLGGEVITAVGGEPLPFGAPPVSGSSIPSGGPIIGGGPMLRGGVIP